MEKEITRELERAIRLKLGGYIAKLYQNGVETPSYIREPLESSAGLLE